MKWINKSGWLLLVAIMMAGCSDEEQAVVKVRQDNFNVVVKANGELASAQTAFISPPGLKNMWRYKLNFMLPEGAEVKKGQVVARFETNTVTDKLKQKRDELTTVSKELDNKVIQQEKDHEDIKVQLAQREVQFRKAKRKASQVDDTTSRINIKKFELDLKITSQDLALYQEKVRRLASKSKLEMAIKKRERQYLAVQVTKLESDLARLSVKASKDGLFIYANNHEGDKFAIGDTMHTGQTFAQIPSLDKMIVKAKISERNLGRVKLGMAVEIVLDANPETKYQGVLVKLGSVISAKAKNNPEKVIEAEIEISQPDHEIMRPGMIARLSVVLDTHKDVMLLPTQAVVLTDGKAKVRVKTLFGEKDKEVDVVAFDEQVTAISQGVSVGEEVLL